MLHLCFPVNLGVALSSWAQDWCGPLPVLMICWFCRFGGAAGAVVPATSKAWLWKRAGMLRCLAGFQIGSISRTNPMNQYESVWICMIMYEHVWMFMSIFNYQLSSFPAVQLYLVFPWGMHSSSMLEVACSRVFVVKATPARGQPLYFGGHIKDEGNMLDELYC